MLAKKILIAGEGGQGIQSLAKIFVEAHYNLGKFVSFLPNFGVEQRGGVSIAFIQVSSQEIDFPKFDKADVVVLFAGRAIKRVEQYVDKDTIIIFDNSLIPEKNLTHLKNEKMAIPASHLAKTKLTPRVFNIIILGSLSAEIGEMKSKVFQEVIKEYFNAKIAKEPQLLNFNKRAFELGEGIVKSIKKESRWRKKILKV